MGYKYIVKTFYWANNGLYATSTEFNDEASATNYAHVVGMAEIIKIYQEDELIYINNPPVNRQSLYA
jgi:hypothetical protein